MDIVDIHIHAIRSSSTRHLVFLYRVCKVLGSLPLWALLAFIVRFFLL
jgi:hypothetical protein